VDNGSTDGSAEYVEQHFPEVTLIRMGENTGFCGAVNAGIRASGDAAYVILLNNDTEAEPDFTGALVAAMEGDPAIFSAQAKMLKMDDPEKMDDAGDFYCALGWAFARGKGQDAGRYSQPQEIFACCAAAAIYRRSMLEETGLLDERHFAYLEDIDLGYRAQIHGFRNWYIPSAVVYHAGSATSGSAHNAFKVKLASRNSVYLIWKNMPGWQILLNAPLLVLGFSVKSLYFTKLGLGKEYVRGLAKGLSMCTGPERVRFSDYPPGNFCRIQLQLWKNCLLRLTA
jgi:GT2 family glycosyltransferase